MNERGGGGVPSIKYPVAEDIASLEETLKKENCILTFAVCAVAGETGFAGAVVPARSQVAANSVHVARRAGTGIHGLAGAAGRVKPVVCCTCALVAAGRVVADCVGGGAEVRTGFRALIYIRAVCPVSL